MISKEQFVSMMVQLKKQWDKDSRFAKLLGDYFDGHIVPTLSNDAFDVAVNAIGAHFEDIEKCGMSWVSWFVYENDFGAKGLDVKVNKKRFKIRNAEEMYDLIMLVTNKEEEAKP
jgi:sulfur transfer complex TusBCD TusB component (DsrH family)